MPDWFQIKAGIGFLYLIWHETPCTKTDVISKQVELETPETTAKRL